MNDNNHNDEHINFKSAHKQYENIRNRAKLLWRQIEGYRQLFKNPWKFLYIFLWAIAFVIVWQGKDNYTAYIITTSPLINQVLSYAVNILILLVFILLYVGMIYRIGTYWRSGIIEKDVASAFNVTTERNKYKRPFLISVEQIKGTTIVEYMFWSRWINLELWKAKEYRTAILGALNAHTFEEPRNGKNNTRIIVIRVTGGATPEEKNSPHDPLFKS